MNGRSMRVLFADGTVADVMEMTIRDRYEMLMEGTRTGFTRHVARDIKEKIAGIEESSLEGKPTGKYIVEPELVPEFGVVAPELFPELVEMANRSACLKEYSVTTRFQMHADGEWWELTVSWDAANEDFVDFLGKMRQVMAGVEYRKYCRRMEPYELG